MAKSGMFSMDCKGFCFYLSSSLHVEFLTPNECCFSGLDMKVSSLFQHCCVRYVCFFAGGRMVLASTFPGLTVLFLGIPVVLYYC
jgi:hypothetical protein